MTNKLAQAVLDELFAQCGGTMPEWLADRIAQAVVVALREPTEAVTERAARAMMHVTAKRPGDSDDDDLELPVLALDPDYDELPVDHRSGTDDDEITQAAVLKLAAAAINAVLDGFCGQKHAT